MTEKELIEALCPLTAEYKRLMFAHEFTAVAEVQAKLMAAIEAYAGRFRRSDHSMALLEAKAAVCDAFMHPAITFQDYGGSEAGAALDLAIQSLRELEKKP